MIDWKVKDITKVSHRRGSWAFLAIMILETFFFYTDGELQIPYFKITKAYGEYIVWFFNIISITYFIKFGIKKEK